MVERSPGRISLRRKDARIERAFAVNAAHENVFFSLQWGTEGSKKPDKASLLYSSNGGTSYNTLVTFDGKIDSEGDPLDTWTGLISLSQPPPDGFLHVAVEVTKKYNNKRRWFHVFSFRAESSCTGSAPETATPTSPPPSPAPSASPTSQPASCTDGTCLEGVTVAAHALPAPEAAAVTFSGPSSDPSTCVSNVLIAVPLCADAEAAHAVDCLGNPVEVAVNKTAHSCTGGSYPSFVGAAQFVKVDVPFVSQCQHPQQFTLHVPGTMASVHGQGGVIGVKGGTTCCEVEGAAPVFSCLAQCTSDSDCPRHFGSKCTEAKCGLDGTCGFANVSCPTEHPCVSGACDPGTGLCAYTRDWTCCDPALPPQQECHHPGDPCLAAQCNDGACHLHRTGNCCAHDGDCAHLAEPCHVAVCDHTTRQCSLRAVLCPADMDGDLHCTVPVCSVDGGGVCVETGVVGNAKCESI